MLKHNFAENARVGVVVFFIVVAALLLEWYVLYWRLLGSEIGRVLSDFPRTVLHPCVLVLVWALVRDPPLASIAIQCLVTLFLVGGSRLALVVFTPPGYPAAYVETVEHQVTYVVYCFMYWATPLFVLPWMNASIPLRKEEHLDETLLSVNERSATAAEERAKVPRIRELHGAPPLLTADMLVLGGAHTLSMAADATRPFFKLPRVLSIAVWFVALFIVEGRRRWLRFTFHGDGGITFALSIIVVGFPEAIIDATVDVLPAIISPERTTRGVLYFIAVRVGTILCYVLLRTVVKTRLFPAILSPLLFCVQFGLHGIFFYVFSQFSVSSAFIVSSLFSVLWIFRSLVPVWFQNDPEEREFQIYLSIQNYGAELLALAVTVVVVAADWAKHACVIRPSDSDWKLPLAYFILLVGTLASAITSTLLLLKFSELAEESPQLSVKARIITLALTSSFVICRTLQLASPLRV